jgi:uncharacterized OB-fold protein
MTDAITTPTYDRPVPQIEPEAAPYWESLRAHAMAVQRCSGCGRFYFPPSTHCPGCLSDATEWTPVSGRGSVWASVTLHRAYHPAYADEIPYNIAIVALEEGPRVWTNVVECPPGDVRVGMPVRVRYDDVTPELTLARFVPDEGAPQDA